jgi:hypothetical protein
MRLVLLLVGLLVVRRGGKSAGTGMSRHAVVVVAGMCPPAGAVLPAVVVAADGRVQACFDAISVELVLGRLSQAGKLLRVLFGLRQLAQVGLWL